MHRPWCVGFVVVCCLLVGCGRDAVDPPTQETEPKTKVVKQKDGSEEIRTSIEDK